MTYNYDILAFAESYVEKQNKLYNQSYKVYDPPVWEYIIDSELKTYLPKDAVPNMVFIYFTVIDDTMGETYKRYYQIVTGCMGCEIYYENENVIQRNQNYPLSDVRLRFTNWCKHMLKQLEPSDIS